MITNFHQHIAGVYVSPRKIVQQVYTHTHTHRERERERERKPKMPSILTADHLYNFDITKES